MRTYFLCALLAFLFVDAHAAGDADNIQISPKGVDFGDIVAGTRETVQQAVTLLNTSERNIEIVWAKGSCGCITPEYKESVIKPGGSILLNIGMSLRGIYGEKISSVAIGFKDGSSGKFPVRVRVRHYTIFSPSEVYYDGVVGSRHQLNLTISRYSSANLVHSAQELRLISESNLTAAISSSGFVQSDCGNAGEGAIVYTISLDPSSMNVGIHRGELQFRFGDGLVVTVPYKMLIRKNGEILSYSRIVNLATSQRQKLSIRYVAHDNLHVESISIRQTDTPFTVTPEPNNIFRIDVEYTFPPVSHDFSIFPYQIRFADSFGKSRTESVSILAVRE